jgi:hypothetical protein
MKKETEMEKKKKIIINITRNEIIREIQIHTVVWVRIWASFKWKSFARYNQQDSEKNREKNKNKNKKNWPRHQSRAKVTKN